jgi:hypothetical protein
LQYMSHRPLQDTSGCKSWIKKLNVGTSESEVNCTDIGASRQRYLFSSLP